jgi:hypothetical protein
VLVLVLVLVLDVFRSRRLSINFVTIETMRTNVVFPIVAASLASFLRTTNTSRQAAHSSAIREQFRGI